MEVLESRFVLSCGIWDLGLFEKEVSWYSPTHWGREGDGEWEGKGTGTGTGSALVFRTSILVGKI